MSDRAERGRGREARGGRLVKGTLSRWFAMGVTVVLGLLVTPVIVRTLGKESYGLWGLAATFVGFYGLFDFGLSYTVARFMGRTLGRGDEEELCRVASTGQCMLAGGAILVVCAAFVVMGPALSVLRIAPEFAGTFRWLVVLCAASVAVTMMTSVYGATLLATEDFVVMSGIAAGSSVLRSLGGLAAVLSGWGVVGLAVVGLCATVLTAGVQVARSRRRLPGLHISPRRFTPGVFRALAGFSAATFLAMLADMLRSRMDVAIVTRYSGLEQAGLYALGATVFRFFRQAASDIGRVTWPRLNILHGQEDAEGYRRFFLRVSRITSGMVALFAGIVVGLAGTLVHLWLGPGFERSALVARVLAGGFLLDVATSPGVGSLYAMGRHRYFAVQQVLEAVTAFGLAVFLGMRYGIVGVAAGVVVPNAVVKLTVQPWYVSGFAEIGFRDYWWRAVVLPGTTGAGLAGALIGIERHVLGVNPAAGAAAGCGAIALAAAVLWLGALGRDDRKAIREWIGRALGGGARQGGEAAGERGGEQGWMESWDGADGE
ncbi:MAG: oligosaccharide flippase family protein [Planctomycetota bacterium]